MAGSDEHTGEELPGGGTEEMMEVIHSLDFIVRCLLWLDDSLGEASLALTLRHRYNYLTKAGDDVTVPTSPHLA